MVNVQEYLGLETTKFIQLQLKVANKHGDQARAIRLQIQLKGSFSTRALVRCWPIQERAKRDDHGGGRSTAEIFFSQFKGMFILPEWKRLREPDAFAKTKLFGRDGLRKVSLSHCCWIAPAVLPLSLLTLTDDARRACWHGPRNHCRRP